MLRAWLFAYAVGFAPAAFAQSLSFADALARSEESPVVSARTSALEAARRSEVPAGALPDPQLILGIENVPATGPVILASNHVSVVDSLFLPLMLKRKVTFLAKSDYFTGKGLKGFIIRSFMNGVGQLSIDRSGGKASEASLDTGVQVLRRGEVLGIPGRVGTSGAQERAATKVQPRHGLDVEPRHLLEVALHHALEAVFHPQHFPAREAGANGGRRDHPIDARRRPATYQNA